MLVVSLCKPVVRKLKILDGGNLNIINLWGNRKKGGTKFWNLNGGEVKGGRHDFWLKFSKGKNLGRNYGFAKIVNIF